MLLIGVSIGQWVGIENESLVVGAWSEIVTADFSHNHIAAIDESVVSSLDLVQLCSRH